ncbi:RNA polymerase sigma-70 factor [Rudanella paleaurantiibacter]|uniref:RNA polymerase sigma-70 factor n=1 Tax=Rudanella paleaurantiibacter TaxID=2614655 RepID=A0A7J5TTG6_9BACT|nr:RNA polymerase sigma-70 factor [Rudanella paleaurantiibacter]KAB7726869.1 RNA polymerase sigma-70 factor [Rudanella paleaurantiibacter]
MLLYSSNPADQPDPFQPGSDLKITDSELIIRNAFAQNVRRGYELLFRRYYNVLCSQAVRLVYSADIAQDVVSEVFLSFWKSQAHLHITTSYRAYLFTAVRNRAYNHLQEEFRRESLLGRAVEPLADDLTDPQDDPQRQLLLTELYQRIETEIKSLPPQCQRVFLLSRFEGRRQTEIAEELKISNKTVESHINRALTHLRKVLPTGVGLLLLWLGEH